jgi:hypothetical protein
MVSRDDIIQHLNRYEAAFPSSYRAQGAILAITALLKGFTLPSMGRQVLEHILLKYKAQHSELVGYVNKSGSDDYGDAMLMTEGAIQAYENLIKVCDLEEPDLKLHKIARFVRSEKLSDLSPGYVDFGANIIETGGIWR